MGYRRWVGLRGKRIRKAGWRHGTSRGRIIQACVAWGHCLSAGANPSEFLLLILTFTPEFFTLERKFFEAQSLLGTIGPRAGTQVEQHETLIIHTMSRALKRLYFGHSVEDGKGFPADQDFMDIIIHTEEFCDASTPTYRPMGFLFAGTLADP